MRRSSATQDISQFACPLKGPCLTETDPAFDSYRSCNAAVAEYHAAATAEERDRLGVDLYRRLLPLIRKSLRRFCPPVRFESRCQPGGCLPEDLVGESYLAFREILDRYDATMGVDFVGYATPRLYWSLEHRARPLLKASTETGTGVHEEAVARDDEEEKLFRLMLASDLVARLAPADAELILQDAAGHSCEEIARRKGISSAAVRKRMERIRRRLRALAEPD